jgi:hypothetical protein
MNKTMARITLAATLASLSVGAQAQDAREGPIEIDKCQTINQPGSYKLVKNLTFNGPSGGTCLSITASFVTIDLGGFTITGILHDFPPNDGAIVAGDNSTGITVRNGSISGFSDGVNLPGTGSIVEGLRVFEGDHLGIAANGIVKGNTVVGIFGPGPGNGTGISASGVISGNYASENRASGIFAEQGSTVIGNTVTKTISGVGIFVNCPSNVTDNTATGSFPNLVLNGNGCNNTNNVAP